jgi:predicted RNase H-like HicB family nuclease
MKYLVLLQKEKTGFSATVPVLPGCRATGPTEEETLKKIRGQIARTLARTKAVAVEVEAPSFPAAEHPWTPFAGMWKDDPGFEDFLTEIAADRRAVDSQEEPA